MTDKMDAGPIVKQSELNLEGNIREIFDRLTIIGTTLTAELLEYYPEEIMQEEKKATYYKRRTPKMSEITVDEIKSLSAEQLYNKIRCLTDPYPNAYILCGDGKKLFLKDASIKS
jgi:methionyl-tRNA formyltransferase